MSNREERLRWEQEQRAAQEQREAEDQRRVAAYKAEQAAAANRRKQEHQEGVARVLAMTAEDHAAAAASLMASGANRDETAGHYAKVNAHLLWALYKQGRGQVVADG